MPASLPSPARKSAIPFRATIADVARQAGVAIATVSGILNGRADCRVSEGTRQRVQESAQRLGYRPSLLAHALHGRATKTLGLLVPSLDMGEIVIQTVASFEQAARSHGLLVITSSTRNEPQVEDELLGSLLDRHVDGIALYPTEHGSHKKLRHLAAEGFPIVTLDGAGRLDFPTDDVSIDQYHGGRLQAEHLLQLGRRRICVVNSLHRCHVNDQKVAGLADTLARAGCPPPLRMDLDVAVNVHHHWEARELRQIRDFLQAHRQDVDALAAVGDVLAVSAIRCALELGLRVPEDLAVVGFNDIVLASQVIPSLTTVRDPADRMGAIAFEILHERLQNPSARTACRQVKVSPELCVRASTGGVTGKEPPVRPAGENFPGADL